MIKNLGDFISDIIKNFLSTILALLVLIAVSVIAFIFILFSFIVKLFPKQKKEPTVFDKLDSHLISLDGFRKSKEKDE